MNEPSPSHARPLTPSEVVLLCDELRAILAAGIPLHLGLRNAGALSSSLKLVVERLATHLEQGRSLPDALESEGQFLPPVLRAIIVAGVSSEQTQDMLEQLARASEQLQQMRQSMIRGLVYPALVVLLTLILASIVFPRFAGTISAVYETSPHPAMLDNQMRVATFLNEFGWLLGLVSLCAVVALWLAARSSRSELSGWAFVAWLPGARRVLRDSQLARSVHLLALLLRYHVPLPQALRSVAATVDLHALQEDFHQLANQAERGEPLARRRRSHIPSFLWWMFTSGIRDSRLDITLNDAADYYRRSAIHRAEWLARVVPLAVVIVVGGGCTLSYGLFVMAPVSALMDHLLEMQP